MNQPFEFHQSLRPYQHSKSCEDVAVASRLPSHWATSRIRQLAQVNPSRAEARSFYGTGALVTFLPMEAVSTTGSIDTSRRGVIEEVWSGFAYFRRGDVIVAKITPCFENGKGASLVNLPTELGFGSTEFHVLRPNQSILAEYLYRLTMLTLFRELGRDAMNGAAGQQRVPTAFVKNFVVPLPPLAEQAAIARYLGHFDAKVGRLLRAKRRLVALLTEQKQAVIQQAVTRGLDPDVPLRDSGVPWLGAVPAHWEVRRLTQVARLESGHTPSRNVAEYWENCTIPWVTLRDVGRLRADTVSVILETREKVSELGIANSAARLLPEGTVILSRTASVGYSAILGIPMATTQDFVNWVCGSQLLPGYLLLVLRSMRGEFRRLSMGSVHPTIYMPDVKKFEIPVPPFDEQLRIVDHVNKDSTRLDGSVSRVTREIDLIREYRTRLVADVVTGQLDVRDAAAGLPEFDALAGEAGWEAAGADAGEDGALPDDAGEAEADDADD